MDERGSSFFDLILILAMSMMLLVMACTIFVKDRPYEKIETISITALKDTPTTTGEFFLGSGTISNEMTYFFTKTTEDGGTQLDHIPSDKTTIYEVDDESYHIDVYEASLFFAKEHKYKAYIPKGSITQEFNVDLE